MSLKDSVSTLTSHFEYLTLNFPAIAALQPLQTSTFPLTFKATYSQQHMREYLSHTTSCYFTFDPKASPSIAQYPSFPTSENDILIDSYSPSKDFRALVRKSGDKNILEIWGKYGLLKSARVSDAHGMIYNDPQFCLNAISWSQDEKRIAYVAEKKEDKFPKYFDDFGNEEEASRALKSYEYRQDLGETFVAKVTPQIFIYDISEEVHYRVMNIPPEMVPTQVTFADKQGNSIVFCGFNFPGVRAGFRFCYNRDSKIYYLKKFTLERTKEDKTKKLTEEEKKAEKEKLKKEADDNKPTLISNDDIAIFPVLNKDLTKLVYCFSPWSFTHTTGLGLKIVDVPQGDAPVQTPQLLFDVVQEKSDEFVGIMGYHDRLNKMTFFGQKYVFFNSDFKASVSLFAINTETKQVRRIDRPKYQSEEWKLTGIHDGLVFVRVANIEGQNKIAIMEGFDPNADSIDEAIKNIKWHHGEMNPAEGPHVKRGPNTFLSQLGEIQEKVINHAGIESVFFSIKDYKDSNGNIVPDNKKPLMVVLHGGPHGTTTGIYTATRQYTLYKGYNILCPNFTGSTGFGQKFLNDLAGKIGEIDVDEIVATIKYCTDNGLADPKRMVVFGGSYGGFLPGVLLAKFPDLFRTAIIRNPVMSVGYSYESSDIPEWAMCETFNKDMDFEITGEEMKKMFEISPIGMNKDIKTSILLQLGGKDRRVAPEAGLQYYKLLKEKGVDITLLWYPDDLHSLAGSQETETDQFIRTFCFLDEKMKVETA